MKYYISKMVLMYSQCYKIFRGLVQDHQPTCLLALCLQVSFGSALLSQTC